jgi:AraC-like DNA-binding protein
MAVQALPRSRTRVLTGEADGGRWELALRAPALALRGIVADDYCGYTERTRGPSQRRELPVPFVPVIIELAPPIRVYDYGQERRWSSHRGGFVAGLDGRYTLCAHDGFQHGLQVNLTPLGARLVFGVPMAELSGRAHALVDLLPARHRGLPGRLQELRDWDARFDLVDAVLSDCAARARLDTRAVSWAWRRIEETGGALDIGSLTCALGYSRRHVIALFRDQVGLPPKLASRIVRFDRLVRHLRGGGRGTWAELALEFGYYDQAHLAREVKEFSGVTPTQVRPLITDLPSLLA